ncbi:TPA: LOW QUALITY PROTEIN: hypothetical protein N0F65_007129, partial [Lagenidium giganteum]
ATSATSCDRPVVQTGVTYNAADTLFGWHQRLGHLNYDDIVRLENHHLANGIRITDKTRHPCESCLLGKQTACPKAPTDTSESAPTDEIGAVLGVDNKTDTKPKDSYGNKHQLHIVDCGSSSGELFPLKNKTECTSSTSSFGSNDMSTCLQPSSFASGVPIVAFSSSSLKHTSRRAMERWSGDTEQFLMACEHQCLPYHPLPGFHPTPLVVTNRMPTRSKAGCKTPLEVLIGKAPTLKNIIPWGAKVSVLIKARTMGNHPKSEQGIFVGYGAQIKGFRVYVSRTRKIVESQHVRIIKASTAGPAATKA